VIFSDVHIFHEAMMPPQNHACKNSRCSHICLLAANKAFTCACPENMELEDKYTCQPSHKSQEIILGIGNYIVAVPHQTFGRHVSSEAEQVENNIDRLEFNSLNGQFFVADSNLGKIKMVDIVEKKEFDLVNQHILSVKSMAFGELTE
jgi:hypothetical protein